MGRPHAGSAPPQIYALAGIIAWNWQRDTVGKGTICQWARSHPLALTVALAWVLPHVYTGSHITDHAVRALNRLHR